ncbi:MAG TPA: PPOX class F420-dependent oxidoreductase [Acidimicrobiales bacterium]|nr:PPOX class F420-dependent oxidoreductase [Acidimicrobiales bacterium]
MELAGALDIARGQKKGVLVTERRDGRPQLSNIMFVVGDDDVIRISVTADRAKTKNLERNARCSLYVGRDDFWAYLVLDADAELSPVAQDPNDATVAELVEQYRGMQGEHPNWDEFRQAMIDDRRQVARLRPTHAYGTWPDA